MKSAACPDRDQIASHLLGKDAASMADTVASHIRECAACQETQATLENESDLFMHLVRDAVQATPHRVSHECEELIASSRGMLCSSQSGQRSDTKAPAQLGAYVIERILGRGGMGVVYKARNELTGADAAIKVLASGCARDEEAQSRFLREIQTMFAITHRNIVSARDANKEGELVYLVMELVEGVDLAALSKDYGPMRVPEVCEIACGLAEALRYAHNHGLVHRDVKPSNAMLTASGEVKLLDLGLARLREAEPLPADLTVQGQVLGTADFIAPEQASGAAEIDYRADVYALGCTLFALLAGRPPFYGDGYRTHQEKIAGHLRDAPPALATLQPETPTELSRLVAAMLSKDPTARPDLANDVVPTLRRLVDGSNLAVLLPRGRRESESDVVESSNSVTLQRSQPATTIRRSWTWPIVTGLVAAGLLALLYAFFGQVAIVRDRHGNVKRTIPLAPGDSVEVVTKDNADRPAAASVDRDPDAERRVARWVLNAGGKVRIHGQQSSDPDIATVEDLPANDFQLLAVNLNSVSDISDYDLSSLASLSNLEALDVTGTPISDKGLEQIKRLTTLCWFYARETRITNDSIEYLKDLKQLKTLSLSHTNITDAGIQKLPRLPLLSKLELDDIPVSNATLASLAKFPLTQLNLEDSQVTDQGLKHLSELSSLQELSLEGTSVSDSGIGQLDSLAHLTTLDLRRTNVTEYGALSLRKQLPGCDIAFGDPEREVANRILQIGGKVDLWDTGLVNDAGELPSDGFVIEKVFLANNSAFTLELAKSLTRLEDLRTLDARGSSLSDDAMQTISQLSALRWLYLRDTKITDHDVAHLKALEQLVTLDIALNDITGSALSQLGSRTLVNLIAAGLPLTDDSLQSLKQFPAIRYLDASHTPVSNAGLAHLASAAPRLRELILHHTNIDDDGLEHLKRLRRLKKLDLRETSITPAGVSKLSKALDQCEIIY